MLSTPWQSFVRRSRKPGRSLRSRPIVAGCETLEARALMTVTLAGSTPTPRIINGDPTSDFPSVGIVGDRSGGFCTGTLISPTHVLTAAHCTTGLADTAGRFEVGGATYATSDIVIHPQYNNNRFDAGYDLSIMTLSDPVPGIAPSAIYRATPTVGQMLTLVGFGEGGTSTSGNPRDFGTKRVGQTPIDGVRPLHIDWDFDSHDESNTGPGDSGGPAFVTVGGQLFVAGVTSGGTGNAHRLGDHSFDTRIDVFATWIDDILDDGPTDPVDDHANSPASDASPLTLDSAGAGSATGNIEVAGDRDVFKIQVAAAGTATFSLTAVGGSLDTVLRIFDANGNSLAENDDASGTTNSQLSLAVSPGVYFVSAGAFDDDTTGGYRVNVQVTTGGDDGGFGDAVPVVLNSQGRGRADGRLNLANRNDVFSFQPTRSGTILLRALAQESGLDTTLTLYNAQGGQLAFNDDYGRSWDARIQWNFVAGRKYYIRVASFDNTLGAYRLTLRRLTTTLAAPPNRSSQLAAEIAATNRKSASLASNSVPRRANAVPTVSAIPVPKPPLASEVATRTVDVALSVVENWRDVLG